LRTWSISFGAINGVAIRLHFTFFLLAIFVIAGSLEANGGGSTRGLALVFLIFFSVLLHEVGHLLVAFSRGIQPKAVMLLPIGGVQIRDTRDLDSKKDAKDEIVVALAGPIVSLVIGIVAFGVSLLYFDPHLLLAKPYLQAANLVKSAVWANVLLAAVNLLPAYPLDGGRLLRVLLAWPTDQAPRFHFPEATRRCVAIAQVLSTFFMFAGIWNAWFMLIGISIFIAVQIEDRSTMFHAVVDSVRLDEIMLTEFSTLSPADTLQDALAKAVHTLQDDFPVIRGNDLVGVIDKKGLIEALRKDGDGYVQSAMRRVFDVCHRGESLSVAFGKITGAGATLIPVVDEGRLIGIVTLQNVMHSMGLIAESRRFKRDSETPQLLP
jgi:Zn-dependent protease/predicted transcriptional regulator